MNKIIVFLTVSFVVFGAIFLKSDNYSSVKKEDTGLVVQYLKPKSFASEQIVKNDPVEILFVGDMMFDRAVRRKINNFGLDAIFSKIEGIFWDNDLVVGNLEGTITTNKSISLENNEILRFTFAPDISVFLKQVNFGLVSLANNHSLDFGEEGYQDTIDFLNSSGIYHFGSYKNDKNLSKKLFINNKKYCFVGYHDLYNYDSESVINEIKKIEEECHKTIVMPHWGEEYLSSFTDRQQKLAYSFIDSGADLIIGTHPHVIEPIEIYKNKAIFYSIGNFVFDQYFSFETSHGLAVKVFFDDDKTTFELIPVSIKMGEVNFVDSQIAKKVLSPIDPSLISRKNNEYNSYGFYIYE